MSYRRQALRTLVEHLASIVGLVGVFFVAVIGLRADLGDRGFVEIGAACGVLSVPVAGATYRVISCTPPQDDGRGLRTIARLLGISLLALVWSAVLVPLVVWLLVLASG